MSINFINLLSNQIYLTANSDQSSPQSFATILVVYVLIFVALYFVFIRPSSKKKKEEAEMRSHLEIGDEITTIGGIMGRVVAIKEEEDAIIIETGADRVKMKLKKWCISTVDTEKTPTATSEKTKKSKNSKNSAEQVEKDIEK